MEFETELMVRLIWDGIPIVPVNTKVIYPEQGQSHFNYIRDNILITKMHIRLILGMLRRPWRILKNKKVS